MTYKICTQIFEVDTDYPTSHAHTSETLEFTHSEMLLRYHKICHVRYIQEY